MNVVENTRAECERAQRHGGAPALPPPPLPPAVEQWSRQVGDLLEQLPVLGQRAKDLATIPGGGDPSARVEAFLTLWRVGNFAGHANYADPGRAIREHYTQLLRDAGPAVAEAVVALAVGLQE